MNVRLVIEQKIQFSYIFDCAQNRFSDADRQKPISDSYSTPQKTYFKKNMVLKEKITFNSLQWDILLGVVEIRSFLGWCRLMKTMSL